MIATEVILNSKHKQTYTATMLNKCVLDGSKTVTFKNTGLTCLLD